MSHSVGQDEKILPFLLKNRLFSGFSCQILHLKVCFFTGFISPCRTCHRGARGGYINVSRRCDERSSQARGWPLAIGDWLLAVAIGRWPPSGGAKS